MTEHDYLALPPDLPVPVDDGAARHLTGRRLPALTLLATSGEHIELAAVGHPTAVVFVYPMTGRPGTALPPGWDAVAGARGCTPESCGFRDLFPEFAAAGVDTIFGLSGQDTDYQREAVARLHLPYALLADPEMALADALGLPTFEVDGRRFYSRLTLIISAGTIDHVFYPVFPPDGHAAEVLEWLQHQAATA